MSTWPAHIQGMKPDHRPAGSPAGSGGEFTERPRQRTDIPLGAKPSVGDLIDPSAELASRRLTSVPAPVLCFASPGAVAYIKVGHAPSNTYIWRAQALSNVYRRVVLGPDDVVSDLPGGRFVTINGSRWHARFAANEKHLFERGSATPDPLPSSGTLLPDDAWKADPGIVRAFDRIPEGVTRFGAMDLLLD